MPHLLKGISEFNIGDFFSILKLQETITSMACKQSSIFCIIFSVIVMCKILLVLAVISPGPTILTPNTSWVESDRSSTPKFWYHSSDYQNFWVDEKFDFNQSASTCNNTKTGTDCFPFSLFFHIAADIIFLRNFKGTINLLHSFWQWHGNIAIPVI